MPAEEPGVIDPAGLVAEQRAFFAAGHTLPAEARRTALKRLHTVLTARQADMEEALKRDLGRCRMETFLAESVLLLDELKTAMARVRAWARPGFVLPSLLNFPSLDRIWREPYGVTLIISPWNYPFLLTLGPLIAAVTAGNCAILKPSEDAPASAALLADMVEEAFAPEHVRVVQGGAEVARGLLAQRFDHIFFTGSARVGRLVLEAAARHLTPVCLELGGKSPCIVTRSADLRLAARRIAWGKLLNAGQTCVAPDYVLVHPDREEALCQELRLAMQAFYGTDASRSPDYARIVNARHHVRLVSYLETARVWHGGDHDAQSLYFGPTIVRGASFQDRIMQEEIFGPILPVLPCSSLDEAIRLINDREKPLALYLFSQSREEADRVWTHCHFGGGCVNDTLSHLINKRLPFGGVGQSGMGSYHGRWGFETFSHQKSQLVRLVPDVPLRYPPFAGKNRIRALLRRLVG